MEVITEDARMADIIAREQAIAQRERELEVRARRERARGELAKRDLPEELMSVLRFDDDNTCDASIDGISRAFNAAMAKRFASRIGNSTPITGGGVPDTGKMSDDQYYQSIMK